MKRKNPLTAFIGLIAVALSPASSTADAQAAVNSPAKSENEEIVTLTPFEVTANNVGYYGSNTMSGTRLNSKIEDLASSITVVTKEQMSDFAMLDINDIFAYEASTEGLGNYTEFEVTAGSFVVDQTMIDPANSNRIRGIGNANISDGNFDTSGRVPVDPIAIDGVEISRGPNSSLFGLGNTAGSVNLLPASANLLRNRGEAQFRVDSYGGYRTSLDVNRVIKRGVLAVRGSGVFQHDGYTRKPSGTDSVRFNGMVRYRPFKTTTISATHQYYKLSGTRPNTQMPRDAITSWLEAGAQTWDPFTQTRYLNGVPAQVGGALPESSAMRHLASTAQGHLYVEGDGSIGLWAQTRGTTANTPSGAAQAGYFQAITTISNFRATQPLFSTDPVLSNGDLYDWSSVNLGAMNSQTEKTATTRVQIEQIFFDTQRQLLAGQAGWYREDSDRRNRFFYGRPNSSSTSLGSFIHIDPNIRLLNGAPNPYFLRPYISVPAMTEDDSPLLRDTYRGELVYKLDLTGEKNFSRWLGRHQVSGYTEYRDYVNRSFPRVDALTSIHDWAPADAVRGSTAALAAHYNLFHHFYVGDGQGYNVDYAPSSYDYGIYDYMWGNPLTGQRVEPAEIGSVRRVSSAGIPTVGGSRKIQKTRGGIVQSHLIKDRVVTTFGLRRDENYNRSIEGETEWTFREGRTKTAGIVVKPLSWLTLHANKSDSFLPSTPAQDLYGQLVPDPTGNGKDYGFTLKLFEGKLNIRVNQYSTIQKDSRAAVSTSIASSLRTLDIDDNGAVRAFGLNVRAREWITNTFVRQGINPTDERVDARLAEVMQMDIERLRMMERMQAEANRPTGTSNLSQIPVAEPSSLRARGKEIEINYNPTNHWTMKLNVTEQETIDGKLAPNIDSYLAERMPVWQSVIDEDTGLPWFTSRYGTGGGSASSYLSGTVSPRIPIAKATENKTRPQVRKYRANLSQNLRLAGITQNHILKRFNVGGALRWEDKGAIGYYGVQQLPEIITHLDANRPIWDKAHLYVDLFAGYRTRLFADRVGTTVQLNIRNLQEDGRLQPVSAYPDGTPNVYRIVDPRQFILTVTFDL